MTVDLLIIGGTVYTPAGPIRCGVAVDNGEIVALAKKPNLPKADRVIKAEGKLVLPGIIDPHVHFRDPGYTHKEDYETGSRAAAAGGVTLVMDQPNTDPVPNTLKQFKEHSKNAKRKSIVDFNHFASPGKITEIEKIAKAGAIGFKIFQKQAAYPYDTEASIPGDYRIFEAFKAVAKTGLPCSVHAHNTDIYESSMQRLIEKDEMKWQPFRDVTYNEFVRVSTVPTLLYLAKKAGVRYYVLHLGIKDYVDIIREAKARGDHIFSDIEFSSLIPSYKEKKNNILKEQYTTTEENVIAAWEGIHDGTIDIIDSDHAPHTKEEIEIGLKEPQKMALGYPSEEHYISLLLNEVNKGKISIEQLIQVCSSNVAKIFKIYPRKGSLQICTDADITIVDLNKEMTITSDNLYTKVGWTPYEGCEVKGVPIYTIVRGNIVMEEGEVIGKPGYGEFIKPIL